MHATRPALLGCICLGFVLSLLAGGCNKSPKSADAPRFRSEAKADGDQLVYAGGGGEHSYHADYERSRESSASMEKSVAVGGRSLQGNIGSGGPGAKRDVPRKMVFNADVNIIATRDLDEVRAELRDLIAKHGAQMTHEDTSGTAGVQRTGRWTIRVPVEQFDTFLDALAKLGVVERQAKKSQDVTEEFYDLEARIKQKKVEEAGLLKLQEEAAAILNKDPKARMEDLLAVRREWNSVRQELERMEGRLKLLANLSDLTTVQLVIQERKNYVPPTAPTFSGQIGETFSDSLDLLIQFGQGLVLFAVGLAPWLPVLAIVLLVPVFVIRRLVRRVFSPATSIVQAVAVEK